VRSSRQTTEKHRQEIVDAAARLFREKGVDGVSVPEVMQSVGMTHGGFYKHFSSKDELVALAYDRAFEQVRDWFSARTSGHDDPAAAWNDLVSAYLSPAHRDAADVGCAAAALASDAARADAGATARSAYAEGVDRMLEQLQSLEQGPDAQARNLVALSTLVGALLLARATTGDLSDAILAGAREHLLKQAK
jgi:TetR/AcrR family transcriptional regulator, transcriptional repressor for nem operon